MSDWVEEGESAPDFTLPADDGGTVKLSDLRGKPVVLYFYPKDDTPGCTKEACAFRDRTADTQGRGRRGAGGLAGRRGEPWPVPRQVQPQLPAPRRYRSPGGRALRRLAEKNMYGKIPMGIQRSTFLIDGDGKVRKVWKTVNVDGHDDQVLSALVSLTNP